MSQIFCFNDDFQRSGGVGLSATELKDGKVLVVGSGGHDVAAAEIYDPTKNAWSEAGSLANARYRQTATRLNDGKVLIVGGLNFKDRADEQKMEGGMTSAEVYDPATNAWTAAGNLGTGRFGHTATLLPDGKVLGAR